MHFKKRHFISCEHFYLLTKKILSRNSFSPSKLIRKFQTMKSLFIFFQSRQLRCLISVTALSSVSLSLSLSLSCSLLSRDDFKSEKATKKQKLLKLVKKKCSKFYFSFKQGLEVYFAEIKIFKIKRFFQCCLRCGCSTAVKRIPCDHLVMGSNPAGAGFSSFVLSLSQWLSSVSLNREVQHN